MNAVQIADDVLPMIAHTPKIISNVSLVCTLYNERETIRTFLDSIYSLSVFPGEFIILDGGSTDGTTEIISRYRAEKHTSMEVKHIVDPHCNKDYCKSPVAKGRNIAIQQAKGEIIVCTDAGCIVDDQWLGNIVSPFLTDATVDVVSGWYEPVGTGFIQKCLASFWIVPPGAVKAETVIPSSRSVAFRKSVWEKAGGYPELFITAEDTAFSLNLRKINCRFVYQPAAIVYWPMPQSVRGFVVTVFRYAYGDGICSLLPMNFWRNLVKVFLSGFFCIMPLIYSWWWSSGMVIWLLLLVFGRRRGMPVSLRLLLKLPIVFLLKITSDLTYVVGYSVGALHIPGIK